MIGRFWMSTTDHCIREREWPWDAHDLESTSAFAKSTIVHADCRAFTRFPYFLFCVDPLVRHELIKLPFNLG